MPIMLKNYCYIPDTAIKKSVNAMTGKDSISISITIEKKNLVDGVRQFIKKILKDHNSSYKTIRIKLCIPSELNRETFVVSSDPHLIIKFDTPDGENNLTIPIINEPNIDTIAVSLHTLIEDMFDKSKDMDWAELASRDIKAILYDPVKNAIAEI